MKEFLVVILFFLCLACKAKVILQSNDANLIKNCDASTEKCLDNVPLNKDVYYKDSIREISMKKDASTSREPNVAALLSSLNINLSTEKEKIFNRFINWLECGTCKILAYELQSLGKRESVQDYIAQKLIDLCVSFDIEAAPVCKGIIPNFKDEVFYVITELVLSPDEICGLLLGPNCGHSYDPFGNWTIKIPSGKPKPNIHKSKPKDGSSVIRVLQLTDLHHDPHYAIGSNAFCDQPLCCRASNGFPSDPKKKAGKWGNYQRCDLPLWTLENMLNHINKSHKIDYIFWTGDFPSHDVWNQTRGTQLSSVQLITDLLVQYFPNIPVFPALGNHESNPVNSFPPPFVTGENSIQWLYEKLNSTWTTWLNKDKVSSTIIKGAYYTTSLKPGYRIISLNMNYCNQLNFWLLLNMTDPAGELQWLADQLLEAEKLGEKVHIIGHIPPVDCPKFWSYNYNNIINRFEYTIQGTFFGHTHFDELHLHYEGDNSTDKRATVAMYVAPSGTTFTSLNPAYRIYDVESDSWAILNHDNYFLNIMDANLNDNPQWLNEYNAKDSYGLSSLYPEEWNKVVENFKTNETLFNEYYRFKYHMSDIIGACDDSCRKSVICGIQTAANGDTRFC